MLLRGQSAGFTVFAMLNLTGATSIAHLFSPNRPFSCFTSKVTSAFCVGCPACLYET